MTISWVSWKCGGAMPVSLNSGLAGACALAGGWEFHFQTAEMVCVLLGQNQFVVLGYTQAVVFALVADQDFLMALE